MNLALHHTLGSFPGLPFVKAMGLALADSQAGCAEVQLCPQNFGVLDETTLDALRQMAPATRFRLHANVRVPGSDQRQFEANRSDPAALRYFDAVAAVNRSLGSPHYTLHAGERALGGLEELTHCLRRLEQTFQTRVGVEGLYPAEGNKYLLSSWEEYAWLLASGLDYAVDLSHLHIVRTRSRRREDALVRELLASEHCIEVHLSGNDGYSDLHCRLADCPSFWWQGLLDSIHPHAVCFYEGNEVRGEAASERVRSRLARSNPQ